MRGKILASAILISLGLNNISLRAEDASLSVGGFFSPKGCGFQAMSVREDGVCRTITAVADLYNVMTGESPTPGLRLSFYQNYPIKEWSCREDLKIVMMAGPGVTVGYVCDASHKEGESRGYGIMGGLSGAVGVDFRFASHVSIYAGLSMDLALHVKANDAHDTSVNVYLNGLTRVWMPELGIRYRF